MMSRKQPPPIEVVAFLDGALASGFPALNLRAELTRIVKHKMKNLRFVQQSPCDCTTVMQTSMAGALQSLSMQLKQEWR